MPDSSRALILFCRYPYSGPVKTRLAHSIGEQGARDLYAAFLADILDWARVSPNFDLLIALDDQQFVKAFSVGFSIDPGRIFIQEIGDLGARFIHCYQVAFSQGYERAAIAASDAPELAPEDVHSALDALDAYDAAFSPAPDGGWSLLALKEVLDIFDGISWSTSVVLRQMLELARREEWKVLLLDYVADVDDQDSLHSFRERLAHSVNLQKRLPNTARQLL
jgi:rSAM/selenodomain-associated transferase 1